MNWFLEPETSRALLTTAIASLAGVSSAFIASQNVSKTIKNQNKGLPPELLRLEKIQSIIINHNSNKDIKNININRLKKEYERSIHKSALESQLAFLGIQDPIARQKLLHIPENVSSYKDFPDLNAARGSKIDSFLKFFGLIIGILSILCMIFAILLLVFSTISLALSPNGDNSEILQSNIFSWLTILFFTLPFILLSKIIIGRWSLPDIETDLVIRNVYQHYSEYFTGQNVTIRESPSEYKKRIIFENSKKYRKWLSKNKGLTSWDYGFSVEEKLSRATVSDAVPDGYSTVDNKIVFRRDLPFIIKGQKIQKVTSKKNSKNFDVPSEYII